jgi:DNA-binding CsgD family transcriptional regulator
VLTYRRESAGPEVLALTARPPRLAGFQHVALAPLDAAGTGALAAAILGAQAVSAEFAGYLHERTEGLPVAVEEVLALARARGVLVQQGDRWARRALDELDVPRGIRDPALQQVAWLPEPASRVVEAAAVLSVGSQLPVLLATVGRINGPGGPVAAVEAAVGSGLLVERDGLVGFRHVLPAEAVYDSLSTARRLELHGRAAAALQHATPIPVGQVAYHLRQAGDLDAWVDAAEAAAAQAIATGDEEEATRLLIEVLTGAPLAPGRRAGLAVKLGWAALDTLDASGAIEPLAAALDQPKPPGQRSELQFLLAQALNQAGTDLERQRRLLAEAITGLSARPDLLAWALLAMCILSPPEVSLAEDREWLQRALEALTGVDDPLLRVFVLGKAGSWLALFGDPAWREVTDQVARITGDAPRQRREANAYYSIGLTACYAGQLPAAEELLATGLRSAAAEHNRRIETLLRSGMAVYRLFNGGWAGLLEETAVLLGELEEYALGRVDVELVRGCLALSCGNLDEAAGRLDTVAALARETGAYEVQAVAAGPAARVALARGDQAGARRCLDPIADLLAAKSPWPVVCWALPSVVETWMDIGQEVEAREFLDRATAGLRGLDAPLASPALSYARGILAGSAADMLAAATAYEAVPAPYEAARASERAAGLLFDAGQVAAAGVPLKRALAAYAELGASWDYARAARLARRHGVALGRRHGGGRPGYGTELSPQERAVAELAARGSTNKEIAAALFISPLTVEKHMSSVMRKVGVRSRAELAYRLSSLGSGKDAGNPV